MKGDEIVSEPASVGEPEVALSEKTSAAMFVELLAGRSR